MVQPIPPGVDPKAYAALLARNQAAISDTTVSQPLVYVAGNQVLPGGQNLLTATVSQLQQTLANIGNPDTYNTNREQLNPSTTEIQNRITELTTPPQVDRSTSITDVISSPTTNTIPNITPVVSPPQADRGQVTSPIISSPVTTSGTSLPKIAVIAVVIFGGASLFLSPKASKRK